jgi:WD40 repeat protein/serine/threonine protein kinase
MASADRDPIEQLADSFLRRYRAGERPSAEEYIARYPELADQIGELLAAVLLMEEKGHATESGDGGSAGRGSLVGQRLGDYRLLREVGRGGMGVVYEAVQESLGRHVALKVLSAGLGAQGEFLERFRREARAAAGLHHTNIVPVFGVGEHEGTPFYVMQFIRGLGLDRVLEVVCRRHAPTVSGAGRVSTPSRPAESSGPSAVRPPSTEVRPAASADRETPDLGEPSGLTTQAEAEYFRAVARLIVQAADALDHAHRHGVLHRDIKPSNLLLDGHGTVWVADFGLAKTSGGETLTGTGDVLGTVRYMAPERFRGEADARSDVYALGATLYELLTLRPAFADSDRLRLMERIRLADRPPPRRLAPRLPRDLETIVLKAMAAAPAERYATAAALADDLRRFLSDRPIRARPLGPVGRLVRWGRRNPALAAVSGLALLAGSAVVVVSILFGMHQYRSAADLRQERRKSDQLAAGLAVDKALDLCHKGNIAHGLLWLARGLEVAGRAEDNDLEWCIRANLGEWSGRLHTLQFCLPHPGSVLAVAVSPDGRTIVTGSADGTARLWGTATGQALGAPLPHDAPVRAVAFRPGSRTFATASGATVQFWDSADGHPLGSALSAAGNVLALAFSKDGRWLATAGDDQAAQVWDAATGRPAGPPLRHDAPVHAVAFHPDGQTLATGGADRTARLWKTATGAAIGWPLRHTDAVLAVTFVPGQALLVTGTKDWELRLWSTDQGDDLGRLNLPQGSVTSVAVSGDGTTVLFGCADSQGAHLLDRETREFRGVPLPHGGAVASVAFFPTDDRVVTGGADGTARVWQLAPPLRGTPLPQHAHVRVVAFSPDGALAATAADDGTVQLWDTASRQPHGQPLSHAGQPVRALAFHPGGRLLFTGCDDGLGRFWDAATGAPDGAQLLHRAGVDGAAFSPDGSVLLTGCKDGAARRWDVAARKPLGDPLPHKEVVNAVAFSPDGRWLLTGSADATAQLWEAATGRPAGPPFVHQGPVEAVAFHPNSRLAATGSADHTVQVWDVPTHEPRGAPLPHPRTPLGVAFHPGGRLLATACHDGRIRFWDVATGKPVGPPRVHFNALLSVAFHPDGRTLLAGCWDRNAWRWDAPEAMSGDIERVLLSVERMTGMELNPAGAVRLLDAGAWWQRHQRLQGLAGPAGP